MLMGVFNTHTCLVVCDDVNIHAWVSASLFDDLGFLRPQEADLQTEVRVFCMPISERIDEGGVFPRISIVDRCMRNTYYQGKCP